MPAGFKQAVRLDSVVLSKNCICGCLGHSHPFRNKADGSSFDVPLVVRIDTPVEIDYYRAGGIPP
jgi:hypothetical protein